MDSPPIRRYSDIAPPHLAGQEFLSPFIVKKNITTWTVYKSEAAKSWQHHGTFQTEEEALHHARTLNALDLGESKATAHALPHEQPRRLGTGCKVFLLVLFQNLLGAIGRG